MNLPMGMCMARVDITTDRSDPSLASYTGMCASLRSLGIAAVGPLLLSCALQAQDSSAVRISGYAEVYYSYDLARPENGERPDFLYNHKRHNEVNLNLGLLRAEYLKDGVRAGLGLMAGTYAQYNLAAEPELLRSVYEARIGIRLSRSRDLWVDAGIFPSHLGAESAIGSDCYTLTRSLVAENSPYYEAGAVISYRPNGRLLLSGMVLNGWQRIQREPGNQRPAFGTQVKYDNNEGTVLNWSTFVGSIGADSIGVWRFYNNCYAQVEGENYGMVLGMDLGFQEARVDAPGSDDVEGWLAMVGIYRARVVRQWWLVGRIEYFLDDRAVVTSGLVALGASLGVDLRLNDHANWRLEYRFFGAPDDRFLDANGGSSQTNMAITTALCVKF